MPMLEDKKFFKDNARNILGIDRLSNIIAQIDGSTVFSGIQAFGGATLASFLFRTSTYRILPYMCTAVATVGTYNFIKRSYLRKDNREIKKWLKSISSTHVDSIKESSAWDLATGTFTYCTNVYLMSEGLKCNHKMWIPSFAVAASGYYFAVSYFDYVEAKFFRNILISCCQLMYESLLITSAAAYLLYFEKHDKEFLCWFPFVLLVTSGKKIASRGLTRAESNQQLLLLKAIEMLIGGALQAIAGSVLAIYTVVNDCSAIFTASACFVGSFGGIMIFGSLTCFRRYSELELDEFFSIVEMIAGPITFLTSCVMMKIVRDSTMMLLISLGLAGFGHVLVLKSVLRLSTVVTLPEVFRHCQRILGPVLIVYSSLATGVVAYYMGWQFSLALIPFIPVGIIATYKGYRKGSKLQNNALSCDISEEESEK